MKNIIIKVQSFGDIITNSSSEVYCIYDRRGMEQIKAALTNIVSVLNPSINIDDHLEFELVFNVDKDYYDIDGNEISGDQFFIQSFNEWCEDKSNIDILRDYAEWLKRFQDNHRCDSEGFPNFDLRIIPLTEIGNKLAAAIWDILNAFEHEEIYS